MTTWTVRRNVGGQHRLLHKVFGWALVVLVATAWLMSSAVPASAHARLIATDPPGGATLRRSPATVELSFSEPIETTFAGVQVFGPERNRVEAGEASVEGDRVVVPLQRDLQGGRYTVVFRIISGDGHPVKSQFRFTVETPEPDPTEEASEVGAAEPTAQPTTVPTPPPVEGSPADEPVFELEDAGPGTTVGLLLARLIIYAALTAVAGLLLAALYLLPSGYDQLHRSFVRRAAVAAAIWVLADVVLFAYALSSVSARPLPQALDTGLAARFLETRFGVTVLAQAVLAAVAAVVAATARTRTQALAAVGVVALAAAAIPWWGHAGTDELPVVALGSAFAHIIAATAWVGGLVVLITLLRRQSASLSLTANKFSRLAGWAFAAVLFTGVVNAALHIGNVSNLWETSWGRLVLGKLIAIGVIGWFGWRNRNVLLPRLDTGGPAAAAAFRRFAWGEVAVMFAAFALAAGLASGIPADAEAASRIQSVVGQFGDGQINVTVDPAEVGSNLVHLYFLGDNGRQRPVENPSLTFTGAGQPIEARLLNAGPGHYTVLSQQFPAAGTYEMRITADIDGEAVTTTATLTVR